jgi:protein-tyrosine phosphatase
MAIIYWLHSTSALGKLGIMARPRGGDWLEDEMIKLHGQGVNTIVSLLERSEIFELDLQEESALAESIGMKYLHFPIPDRRIPNNETEVGQFITKLVQQLDEGQSIAIHCRMGIGRSSIIAGKVLLELGYKKEDLISHISKARGLSVPDTEEQVRWLLHT